MPRGEDRQTFMFSATFPSEIQTLAREFLRNYVWIAVGRVGSTVENIKQQVLLSSSDPNEKIKLLMGVLDQTNGRTLVFVQKRKTASWLCETLRNIYGISVEEIHGDRSQAQRENALRLFRDGNIRILVATDVAARGLDVPAVMHVVQFDMPLSAEDFDVYVHRIGRTGRAGMSGLATSFFVPGREVGEGNGKIAPQLLRLLQENNQVCSLLPHMYKVILRFSFIGNTRMVFYFGRYLYYEYWL
jgi:ATP-dependent RNA helicase DDX3X